MAKNKCRIVKDAIEIIVSNDDAKNKAAEESLQIVTTDSGLLSYVNSKHKVGSEISADELDEIFNEYYDTSTEEGRKQVLIAKMNGILASQDIIQEMFYEFVIVRLPSKGTYFKTIKNPDGSKKRVLDLSKFNEKNLKVFYSYLFEISTATNPRGKSYTNFGGVISALRTPKHLAKREPTGAYFNIAKAVRDFPRNISFNINRFMTDSKELKRIAKKLKVDAPRRAMAQIYSELNYLLTTKGTEDSITWSPELAQDLFHRYMMGWIYLDENNEFMIYSDYGPVHMGDGVFMEYEDGSYVHQFQKPVPLKNYTPPEGKAGDWNIKFTPKSLKKFLSLTEDARKVDDLVFQYSKSIMKDSLNSLIRELKLSFNMPDESIRTLFFKEGTKKHEELLKTLNQEDLDLYNTLKEVFSTKISDELVIVNGGRVDTITGGTVEYKKNHFPIMYHRWTYIYMIDRMIENFTEKVEAWKDEIDDKTNPPEKRAKAIKLHREYSGKLNNARAVRDNFDGYQQDVNNDVLLNFAKDAKHFKRITNAYDIRSTRTDSAVYYDYLRSTLSAAERNYLASQLVKSLRISKSEAVDRASINMFKIPFSDPTVEGAFGISVSQLARIMGTDEQKAERSLRKMGSYLTAVYLGGFMSPFTNKSAMIQNYFDYGLKSYRGAVKLLEDKTISPKIQEIVRMSGITEFSDFFSKSMVNGVVGAQLEQDVADAILGAMIKYHADKQRYGKPQAKKNFTDYVAPILSQSKAFLKAAELYIPEKDRIKMRGKELRSEKVQLGLNKLISFSIEREFNFKKALTGIPYNRAQKMAGKAKDVTLAIGQGWAGWLKDMGVSMSDTEAHIRTISFVIGAQKAWSAGAFDKSINWWEYEAGSEDMKQLLEIGSLFSEFTNFGLSSQAVGRIGHGALGKLMVKFKNWSMQKMSRDLEMFKLAYIENADLEKIERRSPGFFKTFSPKATSRMLKKLAKYPFLGSDGREKFREDDPETAVWANFIWVQGPITFAFDLMLMGIRIPVVSNLLWGSVTGKTVRNFSSDILSFMLILPVLGTRLFFGMLGNEEPPDEEDLLKTLNYYKRKTQMGYVPMALWDLFEAAAAAGLEDPNMAIDRMPIPAPPFVTEIVKEGTKKLIDD